MNISSIGGLGGIAPPPPPNSNVKATMQTAAKALGLSDDELKTSLRSGKSLAEVAEQQGVDKDTLVSAIADQLKTSGTQLPDGVDASQFATNMVERKGPHGPPPQGPPPSAADKAQSNQDSLADALGMDTDELLQSIRSGDLAKLLQSQYTQASTATTGGLLTDQYA